MSVSVSGLWKQCLDTRHVAGSADQWSAAPIGDCVEWSARQSQLYNKYSYYDSTQIYVNLDKSAKISAGIQIPLWTANKKIITFII